MRKILFRGQKRSCYTWLYGDLRQWKSGRKGICDHTLERTMEVEPETIGQYAGMPDRKGKDIFVGDIVVDESGTIYTVVFGGTGFYLKYDPPHAHGFHCDLLPLSNYWHAHGAIIEVIGNIHDNPELLEG